MVGYTSDRLCSSYTCISINELVVLFNILLYLKHWRCLQFIYILSKFNALSLIS